MATIGFNKARLVSLLVIAVVLLVLGGAVGGGITLAQMDGDDRIVAEEDVAEMSGSVISVSDAPFGDGLSKYFIPTSGDEVANILAPGLDRAVADDAIERSQADALLSWIRDAPAAIFELPDRFDAAIKADGALFFGELVDKEPFDIEAAIAEELGVTKEAVTEAWTNALVGAFLPLAFSAFGDEAEAGDGAQLSFEERIEQMLNEQLAVVAEELGVTAAALEQAVDNATRAAEQAFIDGYLDGLVAAEVFSRSEADQVGSWINRYHDVIPADGFGLGGLGGGFALGGLLSGGFGGGLGGFGPLGGDVVFDRFDRGFGGGGDLYQFEFGEDLPRGDRFGGRGGFGGGFPKGDRLEGFEGFDWPSDFEYEFEDFNFDFDDLDDALGEDEIAPEATDASGV